MTEAEWLVCTNPEEMSKFLPGRVSPRKLRLFAAACCRRMWHLAPDRRCRHAVETAERYAEGNATREELKVARDEVDAAFQVAEQRYTSVDSVTTKPGEKDTWLPAYWLTDPFNDNAEHVVRSVAFNLCVGVIPDSAAEMHAVLAPEWNAQLALLHCVVGNPFIPTARNTGWLASTVVALARQMYDARDFSAMPILADALQDAGCDNDDILNHCRGPGPHVRGCWVVDLVLGKE